MCILPVLFYLLLCCTSFECRVFDFYQNPELKGHICPEAYVIFRITSSKVKCGVLCTKNRTCQSLVFDTDTNTCTGCSSMKGVVGTPGSNTLFYILPIYVGCFEDNPLRIVNDFNIATTTMTNQECIHLCSSMTYAYAMTEFTSHCYCGNSGEFLDLDIQTPDTECDHHCAGNPLEMCGGDWRGTIYRTGHPPTD